MFLILSSLLYLGFIFPTPFASTNSFTFCMSYWDAVIASLSAYIICRPFTSVSSMCVNARIIWIVWECPRLFQALPIYESAELCTDGIPDLFMSIGNVVKWSLPTLPYNNKWTFVLGYSKPQKTFPFFYFPLWKLNSHFCFENKR